MRAEQLHVEKNALQREMSSLRSEAGSSREKAELMATMLKQRTDFIGEFQAAAAEREQQLGAHHGEQQRLRDLDAQQALAREAAKAAAATREGSRPSASSTPTRRRRARGCSSACSRSRAAAAATRRRRWRRRRADARALADARAAPTSRRPRRSSPPAVRTTTTARSLFLDAPRRVKL